jgi:hypothetical protein
LFFCDDRFVTSQPQWGPSDIDGTTINNHIFPRFVDWPQPSPPTTGRVTSGEYRLGHTARRRRNGAPPLIGGVSRKAISITAYISWPQWSPPLIGGVTTVKSGRTMIGPPPRWSPRATGQGSHQT